MMNKAEQETYQKAIETCNKYQKRYETVHEKANKYLHYVDVMRSLDDTKQIELDKVKEMLLNLCAV